MIVIKDKSTCSGCSACSVSCPRHCIKMQEDEEGFVYPIVNTELCIDCHICEKVCMLRQNMAERLPKYIYATQNKNEKVRENSSSGGIFYAIAQNILSKHGIVYGAAFNEIWEVHHKSISDISEIDPLMRSKYVQSAIGNSYYEIKNQLSAGREILFVGTPCQVAGLLSVVGHNRENLTTMDFLCHGVPSPKVWRYYLNSVVKDKNNIDSINFRDKSNGWRKYCLKINFLDGTEYIQSKDENIYLQGFLKDLYLRPSCYNCKFKRFQSGSDITVADFWGAYRNYASYDDDKGLSIVYIHSENGEQLLSHSWLSKVEITFPDTLSNNGLNQHVEPHPKREYFFSQLEKHKGNTHKLIHKCIRPSLKQYLLRHIQNKLK